MNLADVFTFLFSILGIIIVFIAYWLMAAGLFPQFVERCSKRIGRAPCSTPFVGGIIMVPLIAIALKGSSSAGNPALKVIAVGVALAPIVVALFGSAGLALRIGAGLKSARDLQEPWRRVLRGGVVLALACVLPFVGTFLVLPYALLAGFGAFVFCAFQRESESPLGELPSSKAIQSPVSSASEVSPTPATITGA